MKSIFIFCLVTITAAGVLPFTNGTAPTSHEASDPNQSQSNNDSSNSQEEFSSNPSGENGEGQNGMENDDMPDDGPADNGTPCSDRSVEGRGVAADRDDPANNGWSQGVDKTGCPMPN